MGMRRIGSVVRKRQQAASRARNRPRKARERLRRDARMIQTIKAGPMPYAPWVMSWLSIQLDKAASRITQDDVKALLGELEAPAAA